MHLRVLEGIAIDGKKVHCAVCRAAVFTLKDPAEKSVALVMSSGGCAAEWAGG
jgi:hypothetical protein